MSTLNLSVPLQHDYTDPTVELDPARLKVWLSDLPIMNVVETVRLVSGALDSLNEQRLDNTQRFRCLEVYRTAVLRLYETTDPLNIRQLSITRRQRHGTIDSAAHLFSSLANGYKLAVMQALGQDDALTGKAINRAVESLGCVLLDCFRYYRSVPGRLVAELHQLYRYARIHGMLDITLRDASGETGQTTNSLYKYGMLLSLTDPDRLAEGEAGLLADVLREHTDRCRIVQGNNWTGDGAGLFLLDLATDALPVACSGLTPPATAGDPYLLDTAVMLHALQQRIAEIPERVRRSSPEALVVQRLSPAARGEELRREQRRRDGRWVGLLSGLGHIHAWLLHTSGKPVAGGAANTAAPSDCRVLDSSDSGMKLFVEGASAGDARVGDLLGVIEGETGQEMLRLAGIRSLRVLQEGGMEAGVEIIAAGAGAVYCSLPDQPELAALPALFLPAMEEVDIAATLIVASGLYAEGRALQIDVGGREISVRAGRLVSDSPVFERFEFSAE